MRLGSGTSVAFSVSEGSVSGGPGRAFPGSPERRATAQAPAARVAVLVLPGAKPLDVGVPAQVFTTRASMPYEVRLCAATPGLVNGADGIDYHVGNGLEALDWAELVFVPGYALADHQEPPSEVLHALQSASRRGARLAAISTGTFALAAAGLLDGKRATTHWHYARSLAARYPRVHVDERVLFADEGAVLTSAGGASGIDLCLHILRGDRGIALANHAARRLIAAPYRSGGQSQYVSRAPIEPLGERLAATREWALHRLSDPLTLSMLAKRAALSPRTLSRRFQEDTGYTPMQWVLRARIDLARELLERSELSVEQIASDVGLGTGANLRLHFKGILGETPTQYRRRLRS